MGGLFASPALWLALGVVLAVAWLLLGRSAGRKKYEARLARVTRGGARLGPVAQATLRKKDPAAGSRLAQFSFTGRLQERFEAAGMQLTPQAYLLRSGGIALAAALPVMLLGKPVALAVLVGLILGLGLPHFYVGRRIKKRKLAFLKLFPEGIDLIVRGLRAGLPVAESFVTVSREIPPPVGNVFFTISQQTGLGVPMEKALADTAAKLDMTEFNFFVTTIILQRETGGNLGEILSNLSEVLRQRQMMKLKIGALSSEARASGYIVGALPFFVFGALSFVSPQYLAPLFNDFRGNMSLGSAVLMMVVGAFVMKRMTQFEI